VTHELAAVLGWGFHHFAARIDCRVWFGLSREVHTGQRISLRELLPGLSISRREIEIGSYGWTDRAGAPDTDPSIMSAKTMSDVK
jgi:hypothetical protein